MGVFFTGSQLKLVIGGPVELLTHFYPSYSSILKSGTAVISDERRAYLRIQSLGMSHETESFTQFGGTYDWCSHTKLLISSEKMMRKQRVS